MVVTDSQTARGVSGSRGRPVTESKNSADILAAKRFHHGVGSHLRRFEMHGDGLIAPRIFQLVASVGGVNKLHAQLVRGIFITVCLVTQFRRKEQQSFGRIDHWWPRLFTKSGPPRKAGPTKTREAHFIAGIKQSHQRLPQHFSPAASGRRWRSTGPGSARRSSTRVR